MIASIRADLADSGTESMHERFLLMLPRIRQQAFVAFRDFRAEARSELTAEVVANAFCTFVRLVHRGKHDLAYATPLAQFGIRQACDGRRVGCRQSVKDVMSAAPAAATVSRSSGSISGMGKQVNGISCWSKTGKPARPRRRRPGLMWPSGSAGCRSEIERSQRHLRWGSQLAQLPGNSISAQGESASCATGSNVIGNVSKKEATRSACSLSLSSIGSS